MVDQCCCTRVGEQILQLALDVAKIDVERCDPGGEGAQQRLDELVAVVGIQAEKILPDFVAIQRRSLCVATQPARVQVCGQTIRPPDDVCVGVAPIALDDQLAVRNRCRDGCGDGGHGEFDCGVGHQASHGWCGSKRTIRPLASLSTRAVGCRHGSRDENLPAVDLGDRAASLQRLVDRGDLAVVDVQEGGPGGPDVRGGHRHPEQPVVQQRNHAAVHRPVTAHMSLGEVPGHRDTVAPGVGQRPRRHQRMAQSGNAQHPAGHDLRLRNLVAVQERARAFQVRGRVSPQ